MKVGDGFLDLKSLILISKNYSLQEFYLRHNLPPDFSYNIGFIILFNYRGEDAKQKK